MQAWTGSARAMPDDGGMRTGAGSEAGRRKGTLQVHTTRRVWRTMQGGSPALGCLRPYLAAMLADPELAAPAGGLHVVGRGNNGCNVVDVVKR